MPNRLTNVGSRYFPARLGATDTVSVFAASVPAPAKDALRPSMSGALVIRSLPKDDFCLVSNIGERVEDSPENFWAWSLGVPSAQTAELREPKGARPSSAPALMQMKEYLIGNLWKGAQRMPELASTMGFADPSLDLVVSTRESARIEKSLISDLASVALSNAYQSAEKLWEEDKESVTLLGGQLRITCGPVVFISTPIAMPIIAQLQRHRVLVPNAQEVMGYLGGSPQLAAVLPEICCRVRAGLGQHVELSLELYKDPEVDDRYLTIYARQKNYDSQTINRIDKVSERFDDLLDQVSSFLLLTTDFRRPRGKNAI